MIWPLLSRKKIINWNANWMLVFFLESIVLVIFWKYYNGKKIISKVPRVLTSLVRDSLTSLLFCEIIQHHGWYLKG